MKISKYLLETSKHMWLLMFFVLNFNIAIMGVRIIRKRIASIMKLLISNQIPVKYINNPSKKPGIITKKQPIQNLLP